MKRLGMFVVCLVVFLPLAAYAAQHEAKKANTIDELAKMYDVSSCKQCHTQIYQEWEKSLHAKSLVGTPRTMATIRTTITDGMMKEWTKSGVKDVKDIKVEHMMVCAKCHLPQLADATDAVAQQIARAAIDSDDDTLNKLSINCLVCHNTKAIVHKWVDGEPQKGVIYGSTEGAHGDRKYGSLKKSAIMKESVFCGQCHGLGPNFDMPNPTQCATLYGSYLHSYVPSAGLELETCQDCHIKKTGKGHLMPAYRDPDLAKKAVEVDVQAKGYQVLYTPGEHIPQAAVIVSMTNKAGHRIPDG